MWIVELESFSPWMSSVYKQLLKEKSNKVLSLMETAGFVFKSYGCLQTGQNNNLSFLCVESCHINKRCILRSLSGRGQNGKLATKTN